MDNKVSGQYSTWTGVFLLVLAAVVGFGQKDLFDLLKKYPHVILAAWLVLAGLTLVKWGRTRVRAAAGHSVQWVGQETLNWMVTVLAATFALLALSPFTPSPAPETTSAFTPSPAPETTTETPAGGDHGTVLTLVTTVAGILASGLISWFLTVKSSRDAQKIANDASRAMSALASALQPLIPHNWEFERDSKGNLTGTIIGRLDAKKPDA